MIVREARSCIALREAWAVYALTQRCRAIALIVAEHVRSKPIEMLALVPGVGRFSVFATHERHQRLGSLLGSTRLCGTALVLGDVVGPTTVHRAALQGVVGWPLAVPRS